MPRTQVLARAWAGLFADRAAPASPPALALAPPFRVHDDRHVVTVPLQPRFRFVHEPLGCDEAVQFVGRDNEMESLAERILFSDGGSFLVTGYRGVGKTSFVNQVIRKLETALPWARPLLGDVELVSVHLNVARPVQPSEMMHHIIRRLHDRLVERGIFDRLDGPLRERLTLAYQRTSVNMARKLAESSERTIGLDEASLGGSWLSAALKVSASTKRSRSTDHEMTFLGYDDKAAEHDVIGIAQALTRGYARPTSRWERWRLARRGEPAPRVRLKIVFVFDELDKLEEFTVAVPRTVRAGKDGDDAREAPEVERRPAIDEILGSLKNLFTTSGLSFIFVAGKDLQERWLEDVGRGDSVYESVFAYDKYLPCLWADVGTICDGLVDASCGLSPERAQLFAAFKQYLAFRGRGIPRRIIRTFNEFVEWDGGRPVLAFTRRDARRIRFFAGLQDLLDQRQGALFGDDHEEVPGTHSDRHRLGAYYLIDWILRQGTGEFTLEDVLAASRRLSVKVALAEAIAPRVADDLLRMLVDADYVQPVPRSASRVVIGTAGAEEPARYRVARRRLVEMGGPSTVIDVDAPLVASPAEPAPRVDRPPAAVGRFRVLREIARGGMGVVYEAVDERQGQRVAVKLLSQALAASPDLVARFEREAMILEALHHPNVVRLHDWGLADGRPYIAMEYLDGLTLEALVRRRGRLPLDVVAAIALPVADAIEYVHRQGFVRNDIKPSNVVITTEGRVCQLDFGISRPSRARDEAREMLDTGTNILAGTPQYMAPEQIFQQTADERSDVYAFGVMLYRMLTGGYPVEGTSVPALWRAHTERTPEPPSRHAPLPAALDDVVLRCLAKEPDARYQRLAEVEAALTAALGPRPPVDLGALVREERAEAEAVDALDGMRTEVGEPVAPAAAPSPVAVGAYEPPREAPEARPVGAAAPPAPVMVGTGEHTLQPSPAAGPRVAPFAPAYAPPGDDETPRPGVVLVRGDRARVVGPTGAPLAAVPLAGPSLRIGRSSENDVVLRDAAVSRYHAVVARDGDAWTIEDANSGQGTTVAGEPVLGRRPLRDGDEIGIGGFGFLFRGPPAGG